MTIDVALPRPTRFSIGRALGDSIGIFARNAIWLLAISCAARVGVLLVPSDDVTPLSWSGELLEDLAYALASALSDAMIILGVMQILRGRRPSIRDVTAGLQYIVPVMIVTLVCGLPWTLSIFVEMLWQSGSDSESFVRWLMVYALAIALFVPLAVATQATVIEGLGALAGLARSIRLTKGRRWAIFGVTMIPLIVTYALYIGSLLPGTIWPDLHASQMSTAEGVLDYFISSLSLAYFSVQTTVLYYYLRREKEGVESGEVAHVFD
jgi:hypothetical protein